MFNPPVSLPQSQCPNQSCLRGTWIVPRGLLAIEELGSNPFVGIRLRGELDGLFRWRTGDYRIVYKIDEEKRLVVLLDVGPRRVIYD